MSLKIVGLTPQRFQNLTHIRKLSCTFLYRCCYYPKPPQHIWNKNPKIMTIGITKREYIISMITFTLSIKYPRITWLAEWEINLQDCKHLERWTTHTLGCWGISSWVENTIESDWGHTSEREHNPLEVLRGWPGQLKTSPPMQRYSFSTEPPSPHTNGRNHILRLIFFSL